ncbi:MAG: DUF308 domain-containing protein [Thermoproteota archaeon]
MAGTQKQESVPKSFRITEIVLGAIILVLAGLALASPVFAEVLLLLWLSVSLLFAGFEGIIVGSAGKGLSVGQRTFRIVAGIIAVGLAVLVITFPAAALLSSVVLLSIGLLFLGGSGIAKGIMEKFMSGWARAMYVIVGGISVALSIAVIASPAFGLLTLYYLIAAVLTINGAAYVAAGITGMVYVPLGVNMARAGSRKAWKSDAA